MNITDSKKDNKTRAEAFYQVGNNFLKKRDFTKAIDSYKDALVFNPKHIKAYSNMGVAYKAVGFLKLAEATYLKALKIAPNNGVIYNNLGNVYTQMNRLEIAEKMYLKAINIYPLYAEAYYNLSQVYYFTGNRKKAFETGVILEKIRLNLMSK